MIFVVYSLVILAMAVLPAAMIWHNLKHFLPAVKPVDDLPKVSVLIPARDEEAGIEATLKSVLENEGIDFEVFVLDDHSTDRTPEIVEGLMAQDSRLKLALSAPLPDGWNGKQFACWQLANQANHDLLLFLDADVRLAPNALARTVAEHQKSGTHLISGFPYQETGSFSEQLLIPMMHYLLLAYLPLSQMRQNAQVGLGAGCGQLFLADRESYFTCGGHESIRASRHDGLQLPRSFRRAGFKTDLFDASDICQVRMYQGWRELVRGLLKNANEGIANSKLIVLFSALLLCGSVLPIFSFAHAIYYSWPLVDSARLIATLLLGLATAAHVYSVFKLMRHLRYPAVSAWLQPIGVACFLGLQWYAFLRDRSGSQPIPWRGRTES